MVSGGTGPWRMDNLTLEVGPLIGSWVLDYFQYGSYLLLGTRAPSPARAESAKLSKCQGQGYKKPIVRALRSVRARAPALPVKRRLNCEIVSTIRPARFLKTVCATIGD
jgi:hypothetical protein